MPAKSYRMLLWALALAGFGFDQATKYGVFSWLYHQPGTQTHLVGEYDVVPGAFKLRAQFVGATDPQDGPLSPLRTWGIGHLPMVNHGALFGLGGRFEKLANGLFTAISVLAAGAIAFWSTRRSAAGDPLLCAALGLILGGTLGNLYDRVVFDGVRDFLYFYWIEWPVFNVADCCLVCGAFLLLAQAFRNPGAASEPASSAQAAAPAVAQVK